MENIDTVSSAVAQSEAHVEACTEAIKAFLKPFTFEDMDHLYNIGAGQVVADMKTSFIAERLEKNERFFDPIKRQNLKTMADMSKSVKVRTSKNKFYASY